jgi:hypothetical protein
MSIPIILEKALQAYSPPGGLQVQFARGALEAYVLKLDALGVAVNSFVMHSPHLAHSETKQLSQMADQLAVKLNYLLEPLRVIEVDGSAGAVQMRSAPPYRQETRRTYYEVLVQRGGSISLIRYSKTPDQPRHAVPAVFTREVFARLTEDFHAALP